ncbi:MAG: hypothetical protein ACRCX8_18845 [Sarcina sp.]
MNEVKSGTGNELFKIERMIPKAKEVKEKIDEKIKLIPKEDANKLKDELIKGVFNCIKKGEYSYETKIEFSEITDEIQSVVDEFEKNGYRIEYKPRFIEIDSIGMKVYSEKQHILLTIPTE